MKSAVRKATGRCVRSANFKRALEPLLVATATPSNVLRLEKATFCLTTEDSKLDGLPLGQAVQLQLKRMGQELAQRPAACLKIMTPAGGRGAGGVLAHTTSDSHSDTSSRHAALGSFLTRVGATTLCNTTTTTANCAANPGGSKFLFGLRSLQHRSDHHDCISDDEHIVEDSNNFRSTSASAAATAVTAFRRWPDDDRFRNGSGSNSSSVMAFPSSLDELLHICSGNANGYSHRTLGSQSHADTHIHNQATIARGFAADGFSPDLGAARLQHQHHNHQPELVTSTAQESSRRYNWVSQHQQQQQQHTPTEGSNLIPRVDLSPLTLSEAVEELRKYKTEQQLQHEQHKQRQESGDGVPSPSVATTCSASLGKHGVVATAMAGGL